MNNERIKTVLLGYRPESPDANDPEVAEALALARRDPELRAWLEHHLAFQRRVRAEMRQLQVPAGLRERILERRIVPVAAPFWRRVEFLIAAASITVLLAIVFSSSRSQPGSAWSDFQARMIRTAVREYHMDVVTSDMNQVRQFLASKNAHADYVVPEPLEKLPAAGGGLLSWRGKPVSMICFDLGKKEILYLFVVDRAVVSDGPGEAPEFKQVNQLATASWTRRDRAYVLVLEGDADRLWRLVNGSAPN